uniref:PARN like, ribonuclease domain containing 1 n=1 Tax=Malurus cyaneus samueli TaxID=2593467 RepID=A0A8C5TXL4_9PASS
MEVGAEGFARCLPRLRQQPVQSKLFCVHSPFPNSGFVPSLFDSPAERYLKARRSVQRFTLVQLGKCCSDTERDANTRYVVHPYNFFLFPSTLGVRDVELTLSASSIQFLSHYGFDYNKFLKDGIPYMNEVQEKNLRQHLLAGSWKVCLSAPLKLLLQSVIGYHVLEVQLVLRQALQNIPTDCSFQLMVKKVSPEHRQLLENSSYDRCQKKLILLAARGFTNLFQILVNAKKVKSDSCLLGKLLFSAHDRPVYWTMRTIALTLCGNSYVLCAAYQMDFNFRRLWVMCCKDCLCPCE